MTERAYPGAALLTGPHDSFALMGIAVRDPIDGRFFGLTARDLFESDQPALSPTPPILRLGKRAPRFEEPIELLPGLDAVTNLVCFFDIDKAVQIGDQNPGFSKAVTETVAAEDVLEEPWFILRSSGPTQPVQLIGLGVDFDLVGAEGEMQSFGGGVEIADASGARCPVKRGDSGAPIVTASGKLVGVVVALGDNSAIVAPLHDLLMQHGLQVFVRAMAKPIPVPTQAVAASSSRQRSDGDRIIDGARIAGVNIPKNKRIVVALQYVHGIGPKVSKEILEATEISKDIRTNSLSNDQLLAIRDYIDRNVVVEGDLRRQTAMDIKRLVDLQCYRGVRHRKGLPLHGQRTHTNARTRKGPRVAIAGKKK